ncbi:hypothetical protein LSAT2_026611 [Lamellibrachia satsuma]|nr:hypothetical protein LSAT2_026611 [Lamellibrachia satsuma]
MGCCFSSNEDDDDQSSDINERSRLLNNPVGDGSATRPVNSCGSTMPPQQKGNEQSALNQILQQTASDIIDVAALDSQSLEHSDYVDRARQYSNRLKVMCNSGQPRSRSWMPAGVAAPQVILASQTVSPLDVQLVTTIAEHASQAVKEMKVKHKEDLVVPFTVP